jgi:RNA polymerase sigma factor (sigma-70 family)
VSLHTSAEGQAPRRTCEEYEAPDVVLAATLRAIMPQLSARAAKFAASADMLREDLERAAMLGIAEAVGRFDPAKRVPLNPFAMTYATRRMADELRRYRVALKRDPLAIRVSDSEASLVAVADSLTPLDATLTAEFEALLETFYRLLPQRQALVVRALVERGLTQAALSRELGVSRTAVMKMVARARARLESFSPLMDYLRAS